MYQQFFFDFDSTLVKYETLDRLVTDPDLAAEVEALTRASMEGRLPFAEVFPRKIGLIAPRRFDLEQLAQKCMTENWLTDGAREVVRAIHAAGKEAWIVTANFYDVVNPVAEHLGIPLTRVLANRIRFDEQGGYVACEPSPLMGGGGKPTAIFPNLIDPNLAVMVGDSVSDLACKDTVGLFVGFGGIASRPAVKQAAEVFIEEPSLRGLLKYL